MSRMRWNGVTTPARWFSRTLRTSPWQERACLSFPFRSTVTTSPLTTTFTDGGVANFTAPLGHFTTTPWASCVRVTPFPIFSGLTPMRDMSSFLPLTDLAEDLSARVALARLAVGDDAPVGREDVDALARGGPGQFS